MRRFLWTTAQVFRRCHAGILGGPVRWYGCGTGTGRPRQHHQGKWCLPRHVRPHGPQVSGEWVGTCWGHAHVAAGVLSVDLAKCVDTHDSLQRHTLGDAVQSGFRGSREVRSTQSARQRCLCSASYPPRMKAKIAEKKATPKEYLPRTRSIATDGPALDQWRLRLNRCRRAVQHGGPHTILRRSRARRWCRIGVKSLALQFTNSSLGPD